MDESSKLSSTFDVSFQSHMEFLDAVQNQTEIGQVLIAASYFDERLRNIIAEFLIAGAKVKDLLDGQSAPLGTFAARIKMAQALGLIDKREARSLDAIRNVRNAFAHNIKARLSDPNIRKMLNALGWVVGEDVTEVGKYDPKEIFLSASIVLLCCFSTGPITYELNV